MAGMTHQIENIFSFIGDTIGRAGIGVCVCDFDGTIVYINQNIFHLFDMDDPQDLEALKKISDVSGGLDEILEKMKNGDLIKNSDHQYRMKSGAIKRFKCDTFILESARRAPRRCVMLIRDTEDHNILISNEKINSILDSLEEGYYEVDLAGSIMYVNKAFCQITEYPYDEIIGTNFTKFFDKEDSEMIYNSFHNAFLARKPSKIMSWVALSRSGKKKKIDSSISLIYNETGMITGFRGMFRDVTEKDRFEKELIRARKLEAIGILSGGIAHDYNNALTAILGNISLAKMEADANNKNLMEVLNDAEAASLKVVELTQRLSTFARGGKPDRKVVEYTDSLKGVVETVLSGYPGKYELNIPSDLWKVEIDEFQINQVVTYILNNAVESMPEPGTIIITADNVNVEQEESHHEITLKPGAYIRISISDHGVGIKADDIHNIFDPYFTTKEMASGMGLTAAYAIIKRHHGYIDVKSSLDEGSTFYIYLQVV